MLVGCQLYKYPQLSPIVPFEVVISVIKLQRRHRHSIDGKEHI